LLSAVPRLHHWFHRDSAGPKHECVLAAVSKGALITGGEPVQYVPLAGKLLLPLASRSFTFNFVSYSEPLTRGPPAT